MWSPRTNWGYMKLLQSVRTESDSTTNIQHGGEAKWTFEKYFSSLIVLREIHKITIDIEKKNLQFYFKKVAPNIPKIYKV